MTRLRRPRLGSPLEDSTRGRIDGLDGREPAPPSASLASPAMALDPEGSDWPWVVAARAGRASAEERARFRAALREADLDRGRVVVETCHRVELYGIGAPRAADVAATLPWRGLDVVLGPAAARHVLRLAAGLESVVLGEEQVLGQVREAHAAARRRAPLDPRLDRLFQIALRVGRAARADGRPTTDGLARRAAAVLSRRLGGSHGRLDGRRILVVGAGTMGRLLALAVLRAGAEPTVASRDPARARALLEATAVSGEALDLEAAAARWWEGRVDGVLVALAGPWLEAARHDGERVPEREEGDSELGPEDGLAGEPQRRLGAPSPARKRLAPVVDLSAPSALPGSLRERLGRDFVGIDDLAAGSAVRETLTEAGVSSARAVPTAERVFRDRAEALVSEGLAAYRSWLVARAAGEAIRALQVRAEGIRAAEVEALFRRLPDLDPREQDLVRLHTRRIVARLLHPILRDLRAGDGAEMVRRLLDR